METRSVNVLTDLRQTTIHCDRPCRDGCEATNLLRGNGQGFMVETFIRPPVTLEIRFPCPIRIQSIQLINNRGSFVSTGIEIRSSTDDSKLQVYTLIGKGYDCTPGLVRFINQHFNPMSIRSAAAKSIQNEFYLHSHNKSLLTNSRAVSITITRTRQASPAVIDGLSIQGVPYDSKLVKPRIQASCPAPRSSLATTSSVGDISKQTSSTPTTNPEAASTSEIPHEFNCALTHELMSYPITLPSGKVIDKTSLEKLHETARSFDSQPTDPFSGIRFTPFYKPIANHLLRERIDRFVSLNNITSVGRATGTKRKMESDNSESTIAKSARLQSEASNETKQTAEKMEYTTNSLNFKVENLLSKPNKLRTVSLKSQQTDDKCVVCERSYQKHYPSLGYSVLSCQHVLCQKCFNIDSRIVTCPACSKRTALSLVDIYPPNT